MLSVVLPVYNAEKTIDKTIGSILKSAKNREIEIIIVNDGSSDQTKSVLEKYEDDHRFNIIHQDNCGVSAARNRALDALSNASKYVAFIDDSDCISENYFEAHLNLMQNYPEINLTVAPIMLLKDGKQTSQSLNDRFNTDEAIVDIDKDTTSVQYHLGGTVFRTKVFKERELRFVDGVHFWEDALLINTVILMDKQYGLVKEAFYFYDRNNEDSLSHKAWADESRYTLHIKNSYFPLITMSEKRYGHVILYIQYLIARHYLQYLLEHNQDAIIQYQSFVDKDFEVWSKQLFAYIDTKVIDQLECPTSCKIYLYQLKNKPIQLAENRNHIKLLAQKIDFKNRALVFTFSNEAVGIDRKSPVHINISLNQQAQIIEKKKQYFLGQEAKGDITLNTYKMPLRIQMLFQDFKVLIQDGTKTYVVKSPSIIKRLIRKIKRKK